MHTSGWQGGKRDRHTLTVERVSGAEMETLLKRIRKDEINETQIGKNQGRFRKVNRLEVRSPLKSLLLLKPETVSEKVQSNPLG